MRYSGIGGQAVIEGVMMKNGEQYAVAVRKPDGEIIVDKKEYAGVLSGTGIKNVPFIRGVLNFVDSLVLGMRTIMYAASFFEDEEGQAEDKETRERQERRWMNATLALSVVMAVFLFMLLPYGISRLLGRFLPEMWLAVAEGLLRLIIFLAYIIAISQMKDIQRVFMYHGAEHKCINCIEHGMELTVDNVRISPRLHKRCGTSFLFLVIFISIIIFLFVRPESALMRIAARILAVPVIAGAAYEFIRLAGRSDNPVVDFLSRPGLALQKLTTREPDDDMIEVGIASVEAVFDWKTYIKTGGAE